MMRCRVWIIGAGFLLASFLLQADISQKIPDTEYSTPEGITLVEVFPPGYGGSRGVHNILWVRLGDESGETLFVSAQDTEPGISVCRAECSEEFPPVIALPGSKASGDWTLFRRDDGNMQWVYQGKPLYRFARETRLNEALDNILALAKKQTIFDLVPDNVKKDLLLPPEGWTVARFRPLAGKPIPGTVKVVNLPSASSTVFTSREGKTLYSFSGGQQELATSCEGCVENWLPLKAAEMAQPVGDFAPVKHANGSRQWTYQGKLLFACAGDFMPGDVNGLKTVSDPRWQIATLAQHFTPPEAMVRDDRVFGSILASSAGLPLYSRYPVRRNFYASRLEDDEKYTIGKKMGVKGCDRQCLQSWQPLIAPNDAHSRGFWEVVDRGDGTRQWSYKGFIQFTWTGDEPGKSVTGNNQYQYVVGDNGRYTVAEAKSTAEPAGALPLGFHWRVSDLYPK